MEKVSPLVSRKGLRTPGQAENLASRLPYEEDAEVAARRIQIRLTGRKSE
jgi:hypothetical protein